MLFVFIFSVPKSLIKQSSVQQARYLPPDSIEEEKSSTLNTDYVWVAMNDFIVTTTTPDEVTIIFESYNAFF